MNVAFTRSGLAKLGFSAAVLATFPTAFFEGMASENRRRILGDSDVVLRNTGPGAVRERRSTRSCMIFAKDSAALDQAVKAEQAAMKGVSVKFDPRATPSLWDDREGALRVSRRHLAARHRGEPAAGLMVRRAARSTRNTARPTSSRPANSFWAISTNTACCPILSICPVGI